MKKFLSILLALCIISALFVAPVSAASPFDYYLDLSEANILSQVIASNADSAPADASAISEYPLSNLFDGDTTTTAILNLAGNTTVYQGAKNQPAADAYLSTRVTIDLGAAYNISAIEYSVPTVAQLGTIASKYSFPNAPTALDNIQGWIALHETEPTNTTDGTTISYQKLISGLKAIDSTKAYRYITITGMYRSAWACYLNELKVKVVAPEGGLRYASFAATASNTFSKTYPIQNAFDGSADTLAAISAKGGERALHIIDLGESKYIKDIKVSVPSATEYNAVMADLGFSKASSGNNFAFYVTNTCPAWTKYEYTDETNLTVVRYGNNCATVAKEFDGTEAYRYIVLRSAMDSAPAVVSDIEVVEYVEGAVYYDSFTNTANNTFPAAYSIKNILDGNPNTHASIIANGPDAAAHVIDLGEAKYLTGINITTPSADVYETFYKSLGRETSGGNNFIIYLSENRPTFTTYAQLYGAINGGTIADYGLTLYCSGNNGATLNPDLTLDGSVGYRYVTIVSHMASYPGLVSELEFLTAPDASFEVTAAANMDSIRFYVAPEIDFSTDKFGMYIIPFAIFDAEGRDDALMLSADGNITTGQNYSADLVNIPEGAANAPIVVIPFVKQAGAGYVYGGVSEQFTLMGLLDD